MGEIHKKILKINKRFYLFTEIFRRPTKIKTFNRLPTKLLNFNRQPTSAKVSDWLNANKVTLNAKKSNYVIFHPYQRKLNYSVNIEMIDKCTQIPTTLQCEDHVKYLGILLDSNLSWKFQINNVA